METKHKLEYQLDSNKIRVADNFAMVDIVDVVANSNPIVLNMDRNRIYNITFWSSPTIFDVNIINIPQNEHSNTILVNFSGMYPDISRALNWNSPPHQIRETSWERARPLNSVVIPSGSDWRNTHLVSITNTTDDYTGLILNYITNLSPNLK